MFGIYVLCQYHRELDCVWCCPLVIWRSGYVEMMWGIGGGGFLFNFLGIAGVSPEYRRKYVTCLVLSCCCCYCCYCCCLPILDRLVCTRALSPGLGLCLARKTYLFIWIASILVPVSLVGRLTLTVVVVNFASHYVFFKKIIQNNLKQ